MRLAKEARRELDPPSRGENPCQAVAVNAKDSDIPHELLATLAPKISYQSLLKARPCPRENFGLCTTLCY